MTHYLRTFARIGLIMFVTTVLGQVIEGCGANHDKRVHLVEAYAYTRYGAYLIFVTKDGHRAGFTSCPTQGKLKFGDTISVDRDDSACEVYVLGEEHDEEVSKQ